MDKKLKIIVDVLEGLKGEELLILDFEGRSSLCDYALICTARSDRNAKAMADELNKVLKEENIDRIGIEGYDEGTWILVDYDNIVVHILLEEVREYYKLEELWSQAKEKYKGNKWIH